MSDRHTNGLEQTEKDISQTIKKLIDELGKHPEKIKQGMCEKFAQKVIQKISDAEERCYQMLTDELPPYSSDDYERYGHHTWIYHQGLHYDAQNANGVEEWKDLSHFEKSCE